MHDNFINMTDYTPTAGRSLIDLGSSSVAERVEARASELYEQGYHCGESVVKAIHENVPTALPPEVMRLASGFCEGFGGSRCVCGALAGAVMSVGMLSGRGGPSDSWEPSYYAAGELRGRFVEDQSSDNCNDIAERFGGMRHPERWAHCTELTGRCARWVVEIAEAEGWL